MSQQIKPRTEAWKKRFVEVYMPMAQAAANRNGINARNLLAQAAFESGWGTSPQATKARNLGGITAAGQPNEFWKGATYKAATGLVFRVYDTVQAFFFDHARLLAKKYRAAATAADSTAYAKGMASSSYISEENGDNRSHYAAGLKSIADYIDKVAPTAVASLLPLLFIGGILWLVR